MSTGQLDSVPSTTSSQPTGGSSSSPEEHDNIFDSIPRHFRNGNTFLEEEHTGGGIEDGFVPHMAELEARATVKFDKMTFFKEQFYHNFFPLSIPVMYYLDGKKWALINRGFMGWEQLPLAINQLFVAANFYVLNIVSLAYVYRAKNLNFLFDVVLIDLLWFMRNMVVATKYAFLSKIEREEMKTGLVPKRVHAYRTLFAGWRDPIPSRVLKNELLLAAVRSKQALRNSSFSLDTSVESSAAINDLNLDVRFLKDSTPSNGYLDKLADRWLEAGSEELTTESMLEVEQGVVGSVEHLPVRLYAAHVIHQASSLRRLKRIGHGLLSKHAIACSAVLGIAHSVMLTVGRFVIGGHEMPGPSWTVYCIVIPGFVLSGFSMTSNIGFMIVGILDFRRRHFIAQSLDELLRTSIYTGSQTARRLSTRSIRYREMFSSNQSARTYEETGSRTFSSGKLSGDGICFDFQDSNCLLAWWACRQLMQNFGLGFYKRIKYYTTYFASYCGVLLIFVVIKMLTGIKRDDIYLLMTVIFSICVFLSLLALMVWPGGDTNNMLQNHGTTVTRRKLKNHTKTIIESNVMTAREDLKKTRIVLRTLSSILEAMKWDNMKSKLSVCGFEARDQLVSVIVAVVAATMSIGIGQIVQNGFTI